MTLQFLLPLTVLVFTYTRIAIAVWGKRPPGEAQNSRDQRMAKSKRKVNFWCFFFWILWLKGRYSQKFQHLKWTLISKKSSFYQVKVQQTYRSKSFALIIQIFKEYLSGNLCLKNKKKTCCMFSFSSILNYPINMRENWKNVYMW